MSHDKTRYMTHQNIQNLTAGSSPTMQRHHKSHFQK
eukprot:UN05569